MMLTSLASASHAGIKGIILPHPFFLKDDSFSNTGDTELIYSLVPLISVYLLEVISFHREKVYFCSGIEDSVLN